MTFGEKINKNFELNPERTPKYSNRSKKIDGNSKKKFIETIQ